jgi:hypothetical protein
MLFRELSPDAKRIETVGFTVVRHGKATPVALPDRDAFDVQSCHGSRKVIPPRHYRRTFESSLAALAGNAVNSDRGACDDRE